MELEWGKIMGILRESKRGRKNDAEFRRGAEIRKEERREREKGKGGRGKNYAEIWGF